MIFRFRLNGSPHRLKWSNHQEVVDYIPFSAIWKNTVVITVFSTIGAVITCPLVAYGFAKLRFKGSNALFIVTIAVMMIPDKSRWSRCSSCLKTWLVGSPLPLIIPVFFRVPFISFYCAFSRPDTLIGCRENWLWSRWVSHLLANYASTG